MTNDRLILSHELKYDVDGYLSLADAASALISMDKLVGRIPDILGALDRDLRGLKTAAYVAQLQPGSEVFSLFIEFLFGSPEERAKHFHAIREKLGMTKMQTNSPVVTGIVQAIVVVAILAAFKQCGETPPASISITNSLVMGQNAQIFGIKPEEFQALVHDKVKPSRALATNAVDLLKPARIGKGGDLIIDGDTARAIRAQTVRDVPQEIPPTEPKEKTNNVGVVTLELHALDRDSHDKGWAVSAAQLGDHRLRMELDPSINPASLMGRVSITGNIDVTYRRSSAGNYKPFSVYLREVK